MGAVSLVRFSHGHPIPFIVVVAMVLCRSPSTFCAMGLMTPPVPLPFPSWVGFNSRIQRRQKCPWDTLLRFSSSVDSDSNDPVASPSPDDEEKSQEVKALLSQLADLNRQRDELLGGGGGGMTSSSPEAELERTAEHLKRLKRMEHKSKTAFVVDEEDPYAAERLELVEEFRFRPANALKEELARLRLKKTGRKPDLARRLADYYIEQKYSKSVQIDDENVKEEVVRPETIATGEQLESFAGMWHLSPAAGTALANANFLAPSPIQRSAIPHIAQGRSCILHAMTGSGKTLAYLLPITETLWSETNAPELDADECGFGLILTPTRELAAQVAGVATVLSPPGTVRLLSRPANLMRPHGRERGELSTGGRLSDDGKSAKPRLIVGSAKSVMISLYGDGGDKLPAPPTSKPEAKEFLRSVRWLVLDEVDRILNVKKSHSEKSKIKHEKPAAIVASAVARLTLGRVQIIAASATVGRPLRRELSRVLGLTPRECPPVLRGSEGGGSGEDSALEGVTTWGGPTKGTSSSSSQQTAAGGRAVTIPPTVRNYVVPVEAATTGSLLASAAFVTKALPGLEDGQRRVLFVLSRGCGLNVRNTLGALKHFRVMPEPQSLLDALEADGTDRLIEVHREVSGAMGVGESRPATFVQGSSVDGEEVTDEETRGEAAGAVAGNGYILVTGEDTVRGLHLDNLDTVVVVGRPYGPDEYTHIAGRTGRAGRRGNVVNVVSYEQAAALTSWERMLEVDFVPLEMSDVKEVVVP